MTDRRNVPVYSVDHTDLLLRTLREVEPEMTSYELFSWVPEQCEDIYTILVRLPDGGVWYTIEIDRQDPEAPPRVQREETA